MESITRPGRPTRSTFTAKRQRMVALVASGWPYDRAAREAGISGAAGLKLVSEPGFHADVAAASGRRLLRAV